MSENENIEQNKREKIKIKVRTNIISMIFRIKFFKKIFLPADLMKKSFENE